MRASTAPRGEGGSAAVRTSLVEDEIEAVIASVTRALAATDDPALAAELVAERRALREELRARRETVSPVLVRLHASTDHG